ncbi:unnamed protein product [Callosobruchus maculatus]|uniref:Lipocalin/cytosolic fatty-acid binding domain-containing protein n=1 Tax=Callosobruchus maculatus TaxID=64391 RepID=A0A653CJY9_CALMS|nr:unnamed protein product [Callosobruchus maculatus]
MVAKSILILLCCAACTVYADFCSEEKGIENFSRKKFGGVWYFAYTYGTRISIAFGDGCMKSDHNVTEYGFDAVLDYYDQNKREKFVAAVPLKKEGGSYFQVTPKGQNVQLYSVLLETDYKNYLTEYFCLYGESKYSKLYQKF